MTPAQNVVLPAITGAQIGASVAAQPTEPAAPNDRYFGDQL
jgi:hypothetical protein